MTNRWASLDGVGACLPERVITNKELSNHLHTDDSWIIERTGIRERHVAGPNETATSLASQASLEALKHAQASPDEVEAIIVATSTPDHFFPSTAVGVQASLDVKSCVSFDIQAACAGFVYALSLANAMIQTEQVSNALVIGVDLMSRLIDWSDRNTAILFGDGAGAIFLRQIDKRGGILQTYTNATASGAKDLYVSGGIGTPGHSLGYVQMQGRKVFRAAVLQMSHTVQTLLDRESLTLSDIDWLIPHQANSRIIRAVGQTLGVSSEKIYQTVDGHANTSAASLPLALHHGIQHNQIKSGDLTIFIALGAGYVYGGAVVSL